MTDKGAPEPEKGAEPAHVSPDTKPAEPEQKPKESQGKAAPQPDVSVLAFVTAFALVGEAIYGRAITAPQDWPHATNIKLLLCLAGAFLFLLGLLVYVEHPSVQRLVKRTTHPRWHGFLVMLGGAAFCGLYAVEIVMPIPTEQEDTILMLIVEAVAVLWICMWLMDKGRSWLSR